MHTNSKLLIETFGIFIMNCAVSMIFEQYSQNSMIYLALYIPFLLFQGLWFYRFYIVGHEASHKKLFCNNLLLNDIWGSIALIPLMVPITIYRKIHYFHHGFNRKDDHTSALDTYVIKGKNKKLKTFFAYISWYLSVFLGGFFVHSLVSVILFLFIPVSLSIRISDAFKGWTWKDQFRSIFLFLIGFCFHLSVYFIFGLNRYLFMLGYPMLSFAWVLSLLVYIFHYDTTKGSSVRFNVRSVNQIPIFSWILMNFNQHATHHQYPNIPWYELPSKSSPLPPTFNQRNQQTRNFFRAILNQYKGPIIVYDESN